MSGNLDYVYITPERNNAGRIVYTTPLQFFNLFTSTHINKKNQKEQS